MFFGKLYLTRKLTKIFLKIIKNLNYKRDLGNMTARQDKNKTISVLLKDSRVKVVEYKHKLVLFADLSHKIPV